MVHKPVLSIVIPVFNEQENLPLLFDTLKTLEKELIAIDISVEYLFSDNASVDESWTLISQFAIESRNVRAIRMARNYGYQASLMTAFGEVQTEALVVYQSDMQDPYELVVEMAKKWQEGYRSVAGVAISRAEGFLDRKSRNLFYRILNSVSDRTHPPGLQDFYLLKKEIYTEIAKNPRNYQFIRSQISQDFGFEVLLDYQRMARTKGITKFNFRDKFNLAFDGILANNTKFRQKFVISSCIFSALSVLAVLTLLTLFASGWRTVSGWISIAVLQLTALSFTSLALSFVLEIVGRLYQIQVRPINTTIVERTRLSTSPKDGELT